VTVRVSVSTIGIAEAICQSIGIAIGDTFIVWYRYRYRRYFLAAVSLSIIAILLESIVNNPAGHTGAMVKSAYPSPYTPTLIHGRSGFRRSVL